MPYARPWDETKPPGSRLANQIDDIFRELKLDLRERLADAGIDLTEDPVTFDVAGLNISTMKALRYIGTQPTGSKGVEVVDVKAQIAIQIDLTTDSNGFFTIALDEFPGTWLVQDLVGFSRGQIMFLHKPWRAVHAPDDIQMTSFDPTANTLRFNVRDFAGTTVANKLIFGVLVFFNTVNPY